MSYIVLVIPLGFLAPVLRHLIHTANVMRLQLCPSRKPGLHRCSSLVFFLSYPRSNSLANPIGSPFKVDPKPDHFSPPPLQLPCSKPPPLAWCLHSCLEYCGNLLTSLPAFTLHLLQSVLNLGVRGSLEELKCIPLHVPKPSRGSHLTQHEV